MGEVEEYKYLGVIVNGVFFSVGDISTWYGKICSREVGKQMCSRRMKGYGS